MYFSCICGQEGGLHVLLLCHLEGPPVTFHFYVMKICLLSFNLMKQPVLASNFFCNFLIFLSLHRIEESLGLCSRLDFGLRECCGWFDLPPRPLKLSPYSNKPVLLSYHLFVLWSSTFNFFQELFLCIHNLANGLVQDTYLAFGLSRLSSCLPH